MKKSMAVRILLLLVWSAAIAGTARAAEVGQGQLTQIKGSVEIKKRGGQDWIAAYEGMKVDPGDQIASGIDGQAVLVLKNSKTDIMPLTQFVVGRLVETQKENYTELFLQVGNGAAEVPKKTQQANKFNIITPTTVAGVRGTRMNVSHFPMGGTQVKVRDGSAFVSLVSAKNLPAAALPILGIKIEEKKKEKEEKAEKEEKKKEAEGLVGKEATPEAAVEMFNKFLEQTEQTMTPERGMENLELISAKTFEYVVIVGDGQRIGVTDPTNPASVVTPAKAQEQDAQSDIAPAGLSATEVQATTTTVETVEAPPSIQINQEQSTFSQSTEAATKTSTAQGGIPPSSSLVPPSLPDRTGKTNLTN